ncbi:MFS transporter [Parasphingorhabdus cellanae]|uniref:MFS transporter n=1 Tax=Parasphingorhabdus cellanae TaxID=2806553 RepID=A0ABX7T671_9SPHN|nr:glycoside-pentoside-hexuronide (GPH):cation symporter [Parasphingorhabdus cellanae]QTD57083.1 MFS transporter [Parasphingorhabdus cellanae]
MTEKIDNNRADPNATSTTLGSRIAFGFGDFGVSIGWNVTNLFVLYYYTEAVGLPNTVAGTIIMGAMIWDAITDPAIGILASWTRTRWGRYRPYMLFGCVPLALSLALMFYHPDLEGTELIVFVAATHLLFRTCYTVVAIPYQALIARLSKNADERSSLAVWRLLFATLSGALIGGLTLDLSKALGDGDLAAGFGQTAVLYAVVSVIAILICFAVTRERESEEEQNEPLPSLRDIFHMLSKNSAFWLLFTIIFIGGSAGTIAGKSGLYFLKYNLDGEHLMGLFVGSYALIIGLAVPFWSWVSKLRGKKFVLLTAFVITILVNIALYTLIDFGPAVVLPFMVLGAVGVGAVYLAISSAMPDTVEYGEWKTGVRAEGVIYGLMAFGQKMSLGIATGILGVGLDLIGYRANEVQTAEAEQGLRYLVSLVPMGFYIICLFLASRFDLNQDKHAKIVREIADRKRPSGAGPTSDG